MLWKPINFQGVVVIEEQLVSQLRRYLEEKRAHLSQAIMQAFDIPAGEGVSAEALDLGDTVAKAIERVDRMDAEHLLPLSWQQMRDKINQAAWEYVEVLEGCVVELLQQLDHVRIDRLSYETLQAVAAIRRLLMDKILEAARSFKALDGQVRRVKKGGVIKESNWWRRIRRMIGLRGIILDRFLVDNLDKTGQFLCSRDRELREMFEGFQKLENRVQESMIKFDHYSALQQMQDSIRDRYFNLYRLLKIWSANLKARVVSDRALKQLIRGEASIEDVTTVFTLYSRLLGKALFELSRRLKAAHGSSLGKMQEVKNEILRELDGYSREVRSLGSTVNRYREFLLKTDPNPYVRSRWGFSEWVVGPEPRETRQLVKVGYSIENLDGMFQRLRQSLLRTEHIATDIRSTSYHYAVQSALHEMGQPLASRAMLRKKADALVEALADLDELGSTHPAVVGYHGEVLGRAMRVDWKYHVLHEIPAFHELYTIHRGIVGLVESEEECQRLRAVKAFARQVGDWVKSGEIASHYDKVQEGIAQISHQLQEFLASLKEPAEPVTRQWVRSRQHLLLQYRYHFGSFCQHFCQQEEGQRARTHFMDVDQYLELIESRLYDLEEGL